MNDQPLRVVLCGSGVLGARLALGLTPLLGVELAAGASFRIVEHDPFVETLAGAGVPWLPAARLAQPDAAADAVLQRLDLIVLADPAVTLAPAVAALPARGVIQVGRAPGPDAATTAWLARGPEVLWRCRGRADRIDLIVAEALPHLIAAIRDGVLLATR